MKVRYVAFALLAVLASAAPANANNTSAAAPIVQTIGQEAGYRLWVQSVWKARLVRAQRLAVRDTVWDRLAECETGGNWRHRTPTYQGGLGFYHGSWDAYRPRRFPREAYLATREEQIAVGKRILADVGWGAWPACSVRLGLR